MSLPVHLVRIEGNQSHPVESRVVGESAVRLHVNGRELATIMCSPDELDLLALGFLRSERIVQSTSDIRLLRVCPSHTCVEVWLRDAEFEPPSRFIITSGCGGGVSFSDLRDRAERVESTRSVTPAQISRQLIELQTGQDVRGLHMAALSDGDQIVATARDVGRHNTIDKLWGYCLLHDIATEDQILLSTGRISSEMLGKAARMGVPVVASRTSPTSLAVELAVAWNITLVGYVRRESMYVYAGIERIAPAHPTQSPIAKNEEVGANANLR